jgi:hypothetical protein
VSERPSRQHHDHNFRSPDPADLSRFHHLQPGDLIYTGTPEVVGPALPGSRIDGHIEGVGEVVPHVCATWCPQVWG